MNASTSENPSATGKPLLPFVDAYTIEVGAPPERVWDRLAQQALPSFGGGWGRVGTGRLGRLGARLMHAPYADQPVGTADAKTADAKTAGASLADTPAADAPVAGLAQTMTGFRVERATRPSLIVLAGEHRFASYALTLRIDSLPDDSRCRLTAETRADFPGAAGRAYRAFVIGTGAHRVVVARLLHRVR
ncbi:MAG TPA: hypothetical protein VGF95_16255 [Solirubrobacteraceae bacterium]